MRTNLYVTILLISVSAVCTAQTQAAPAQTAHKELSYDGYYVSIRDSNSLSMFKYYLRFYSDGTVIGVTTAGKPANLLPWFKKENNTPSRGKYEITDSTIKFSMTSDQGEVTYDGTLTFDNKLVLVVKSLINKYTGKEQYAFMKMETIK